jgi:hypothetical protein
MYRRLFCCARNASGWTRPSRLYCGLGVLGVFGSWLNVGSWQGVVLSANGLFNAAGVGSCRGGVKCDVVGWDW